MKVVNNVLTITNPGNQASLNYDATHNALLAVSSTGVLMITPTGITLKLTAATTAGASLNVPLGVAPTKPNAGDIWAQTSDNNIRFQASSTTYIIPKCLTGSASLTFGTISAASAVTKTLTVTGAQVGDPVVVGIPAAAQTTDVDWTGWVSATSTVTIQGLNNNALAGVTIAAATFSAVVIRLT